MQRPNPGAIYNVVDDDPAGRACVMAFAAELLRAQPVPALDSLSTSSCNAASHPLQADSRSSVKSSQQPAQVGGVDGPSDTGSMVKGGRRAEKRVCNAKIKAELSWALEFPSYREGLAAIHAGDLRPFS